MAANPKLPVEKGSGLEQYHIYHAEAQILSGHLKHPIKQPIELEGHVILEKTRREGHITRSTNSASMEGLISFKAGLTRASGNKIEKKDPWGNDHSGWVTLSTSVIESLNIFEVLTADRVVAQVSTEHPMKDGHVPKVTFLGTRFENLRIGGYPVELELDLGICGSKPKKDRPYLEDPDFLKRVEKQLEAVTEADDVPEGLAQEYKSEITGIDDLRKRAKRGLNPPKDKSIFVHCSLVKKIGPIPIPGVKIFGNIIFIPDFGTVALAELEAGLDPSGDEFGEKNMAEGSDRNGHGSYFTLNMLNIKLGCIGGGSVKAGTAKANGMTRP